MFFRLSTTLIALFSFVAVVAAIPVTEIDESHGIQRRASGNICGSEPTLEEVNVMEDAFASGNDAVTSSASPKIPVIFNVIYASMDYSGGNVPDSQINEQINVLNREYARTGLSFYLQGIRRVSNSDWFNNVAPENMQQTAMKNALYQGGPNTLNVYTVGFNNDAARGLLGFATFPANYASNPKNDGVLLHYATLPGGSATLYNLGRILVHEVGHWVGLYHTFQNGCDGDGDFVDDTPAEASPASGCPVGRDTCPSPGLDPVRNHMDYTNDECRIGFTPGQGTRLRSQVRRFRGIGV